MLGGVGGCWCRVGVVSFGLFLLDTMRPVQDIIPTDENGGDLVMSLNGPGMSQYHSHVPMCARREDAGSR